MQGLVTLDENSTAIPLDQSPRTYLEALRIASEGFFLFPAHELRARSSDASHGIPHPAKRRKVIALRPATE
jgi:hypothetical protein